MPLGIQGLDEITEGGLPAGRPTLISGSAGAGKSSVGTAFIDAACRRGERALLFVYEESAAQVLRNMRSIGLHLETWLKKELLQIHALRPTLQGLEQHLVQMYDNIKAFQPAVVVIDRLNSLTLERGSQP